MAKQKAIYQFEHTIPGHHDFCKTGIEEIKKRMMNRLINEIPIENLETIFRIKEEKDKTGTRILMKIEL